MVYFCDLAIYNLRKLLYNIKVIILELELQEAMHSPFEGWPRDWLRRFDSYRFLLMFRKLLNKRTISPRKMMEIKLSKKLNLLDDDYLLDLYFNR